MNILNPIALEPNITVKGVIGARLAPVLIVGGGEKL